MAESEVGDFASGVEHAGHVATASNGLVSQCQTGETLHVGTLKMQCAETEEVERLTGERQTLRVTEGILDGEAHVGRAQLSHDGSVGKLHGRMDDALGMYYHLDVFGFYAVEPMSLNHFKPLVEHRG